MKWVHFRYLRVTPRSLPSVWSIVGWKIIEGTVFYGVRLDHTICDITLEYAIRTEKKAYLYI
jgi:hypothetical protein